MQNFRFGLVTSVLHGLVEQAAIEVIVTSPVFQGLVELTTFEIFTEIFVISPVFQGLVECLLKFSLKFSSACLFSKDWLSLLFEPLCLAF